MALNPAAEVPTGNPGSGVQVFVNPGGAQQQLAETIKGIGQSRKSTAEKAAQMRMQGSLEGSRAIGQGLQQAGQGIAAGIEARNQRKFEAEQRDKDRAQQEANRKLQEKNAETNRVMQAMVGLASDAMSNDPFHGSAREADASEMIRQRQEFDSAKRDLLGMIFVERQLQARQEANSKMFLGALDTINPGQSSVVGPPKPAAPQAPTSQPSAGVPGSQPAMPAMPSSGMPTPQASSGPQPASFADALGAMRRPTGLTPETQAAITKYYGSQPETASTLDFDNYVDAQQVLANTDLRKGYNGIVDAVASISPLHAATLADFNVNFGAKAPQKVDELQKPVPPEVSAEAAKYLSTIHNTLAKTLDEGQLGAEEQQALTAMLPAMRKTISNWQDTQGKWGSSKAVGQYYFGKLNLAPLFDSGDLDGVVAALNAEDQRLRAQENQFIELSKQRGAYNRDIQKTVWDMVLASAHGDYQGAESLKQQLRQKQQEAAMFYGGSSPEDARLAFSGAQQTGGYTPHYSGNASSAATSGATSSAANQKQMTEAFEASPHSEAQESQLKSSGQLAPHSEPDGDEERYKAVNSNPKWW